MILCSNPGCQTTAGCQCSRVDTRDATISHLQSEIARYREALKEIVDGRGKCETCGTPCVGEGAGVTECDCSRPIWIEQDPTEIARAALGGSNDKG